MFVELENVQRFWRCENAQASAFSIKWEADEIWSWEAVTLKSVVKLNLYFVLDDRENKTIIQKKKNKKESGEKRVK